MNGSNNPPRLNGRSRALVRPEYIDLTQNAEKETPNPLLEYWGIIRRRKLFIALLSRAGAIGGVIAYIVGTPVYQAMTTLELQGFNENFMNLSVVDPQAGTGSYSANQLNIATQIKIIESASLKAPVLDRLERETVPVMPPPAGISAMLRSRLKIGPQDPLENIRQALQMASYTLGARPITGTRLISISCESTTPDIAANYVNAMAAEFITQNNQVRSTTAQKTTQWLEGQVEETKAKLTQAESRLQAFERSSGVYFSSEQDTLANSRLKQLQTDLAVAQADKITKRTKYEMVKAVPPDSLPTVVDDPNLREYQNKIATLRSERAFLLTTFTPEYYKVKRLDNQIGEIESAREKERENLMRRIQNEYEAADRRENLLTSAYLGQSKTVLSQGDKAMEYGLLKREVDITRISLNALLQQSNQVGGASVIPTNSVRVIDPARSPSYPFKPQLLSQASYGLMLGFGLGGALALLHGIIRKFIKDKTFAQPGHTSSLLKAPELGAIPSAGFDPIRSARRFSWGKRRLGTVDALTATAPVELIAWHQNSSLIADSFRSVLASIMTAENYGSRPRVIVVTSPGPAEGKTMVISNLAVAIAETGRRVLVIDTDLRRPRLHQIFNLENNRGFSDLAQNFGLIMQPDLIQSTQVPHVWLLSSGSAKSQVIGQLFHSPAIRMLIKRLRDDFDTILIDTPPMLHFSEARLMGRLANGVILVLRAGATDRESALMARQRLFDDNVPLLGTILNDWDPTEGHPDRAYGHYYTYYSPDAAHGAKE